MWRLVNSEWQLTHLAKFYAAWRDFGGERFAARSDSAHVQVATGERHGGGGGGEEDGGDQGSNGNNNNNHHGWANWTVALNNADHLVPARVALAWPPLPAGAVVVGARVRRLAWDASAGAPALTDAALNLTTVALNHDNTSSSSAANNAPPPPLPPLLLLPTSISLAPAELALLTVRVEMPPPPSISDGGGYGAAAMAAARASFAPTAAVNVRTFPSPQLLLRLPGSSAGTHRCSPAPRPPARLIARSPACHGKSE